MDLFDVQDYFEARDAMARVKCPTLVMGITTDVLFPVQQQRDLAEELKRSGVPLVMFVRRLALILMQNCAFELTRKARIINNVICFTSGF